MDQAPYPVQFSIAYPDRPLDRLTTAFRMFMAIPVAIVLGSVSAATSHSTPSNGTSHATLDVPYPDVPRDLNRWLPLVKWLLAIPHYITLFFLSIAAVLVVIVAWSATLVTGQYPKALFTFVEGVFRWSDRVSAYALLLVTDRYPPFRLAQ